MFCWGLATISDGDISRRGPRKIDNAELVAALELCVDALGDLARLDDGTPSISALHLARAALTKVS